METKEVTTLFTEWINERLNSKLFLNIFLSWLIFNWHLLIWIFWGSGLEPAILIQKISNHDYYILPPILLGLFWTFAVPVINSKIEVYRYGVNRQKELDALEKVDKIKPVPAPDFYNLKIEKNELYNQYSSAIREYQNVKADYDGLMISKKELEVKSNQLTSDLALLRVEKENIFHDNLMLKDQLKVFSVDKRLFRGPLYLYWETKKGVVSTDSDSIFEFTNERVLYSDIEYPIIFSVIFLNSCFLIIGNRNSRQNAILKIDFNYKGDDVYSIEIMKTNQENDTFNFPSGNFELRLIK